MRASATPMYPVCLHHLHHCMGTSPGKITASALCPYAFKQSRADDKGHKCFWSSYQIQLMFWKFKQHQTVPQFLELKLSQGSSLVTLMWWQLRASKSPFPCTIFSVRPTLFPSKQTEFYPGHELPWRTNLLRKKNWRQKAKGKAIIHFRSVYLVSDGYRT